MTRIIQTDFTPRKPNSLFSTSAQVPLSRFDWDAEAQLFLHPSYGGFPYSDGVEIEARIHRILREAKDCSLFSEELQVQITDWASEYHLSEQRHNLLRHFPFGPSDRILELGAGCGAITRQLGESGATVTALEGSRQRAQCTALRCQGLPNVTVYCGDFQKVDFAEKYDYITLIGVLEYCPLFFEVEDPFGACLELVRNALKPDGKLILAIENRLGLKYFAGMSEDHVGKPFFGIQDLYTPRTPRTFGQEELRTLLQQSGFASIEFQYPFPDYKLPRAVFTERAFHTEGFAPGEIIRQFKSRDYAHKTRPTIYEGLVWPQLASNHLARALSNSFLVIAGARPALALAEPPHAEELLAAVYSVERKHPYKTETRFMLGRCDAITVEKRRLLPRAVSTSTMVAHVTEDACYADGVHFDSDLMKKLVQTDTEGFFAYCRLWLDYVRAEGLVEGADGSWESLIRPEFYDCIPRNLILNEIGLEYIDREWRYIAPCSLAVLTVRGLYYFLGSNLEYVVARNTTFGKVLKGWLATLGLKFDAALLNEFIAIESRFCEVIHCNGKSIPRHIRRQLRWSKRRLYRAPPFADRAYRSLRRKAKSLLLRLRRA